MRIYIAGKIGKAGVAAMRYRFDEAAAELKAQGFEPVNPCDVAASASSWEAAMVADLHALLDCEAVYVLDNWKSSPGATIEVQLALRLHKAVYYEKGCPYRAGYGHFPIPNASVLDCREWGA